MMFLSISEMSSLRRPELRSELEGVEVRRASYCWRNRLKVAATSTGVGWACGLW